MLAHGLLLLCNVLPHGLVMLSDMLAHSLMLLSDMLAHGLLVSLNGLPVLRDVFTDGLLGLLLLLVQSSPVLSNLLVDGLLDSLLLLRDMLMDGVLVLVNVAHHVRLPYLLLMLRIHVLKVPVILLQ